MFIHEKIYEAAIEKARNFIISDVRIGLGYTLVELDKTACGLSYSFTKELNSKTCTVLNYAGELVGEKASYLIEKIFSYNLLDSVLAIAAANAILNEQTVSDDYDIVSSVNKESSVVMIGYFGPLVPIIEKKAKRFVVCERDSKRDVFPDFAAYFELKKCDIAVISATTLINKTIDNLLEAAEAETVAILGPSALMDKEVFKDTNVTHLCGSFVTDIKKAKLIISQGGGTQVLKAATKKGCVICQS